MEDLFAVWLRANEINCTSIGGGAEGKGGGTGEAIEDVEE